MLAQPSLENLVRTRRIVVCVGSGGVGKTTTAASLGLSGARAGKKTLVLTIDPAKRLAQALGMPHIGHAAEQVAADKLAAVLGGEVKGTLDALMLDQKRAFDEIVERYTQDAAQRERIFKNRIYQQISSSLAGSHEYAAMSKLHEIANQKQYDLIVLDTPPVQNALDFLEAPERVTAAIDSPAIEWLVRPYLAAGHFSLKALGVGASFVLGRLGRFVGSQFLEEMAQFFVEFNAILGGFRERAREVFNLLRSNDATFVLVSSAEAPAIDEVLAFSERLRLTHMSLGGCVVNRVHERLPPQLSRQELIDELSARPELRGFSLDDIVQVAADLDRTAREFSLLAESDEKQIARLVRGDVPLVRVPYLDTDIGDVAALGTIVRCLMGDPKSVTRLE